MVVICIGHGKVISIDREITHQIADTSKNTNKIAKITVFWPGNGCFVWQDNFSAQAEHNFTGRMGAAEM